MLPILGSNGSFPRKGISSSDAIFSPPPVVGGNIWDSVWKETWKIRLMQKSITNKS